MPTLQHDSPRLSSSTAFLTAVNNDHVRNINSLQVLDPEFDEQFNEQPITSEGLDHLLSWR